MNIFFPKEHINEPRFSLTGETAEKFLKKNIDLYIEETVEFQDALLKNLIETSKVKTIPRHQGLSSADIICSLNKLNLDDINHVKQDALIVSFLDPFKNKKWHGENVYSWNANRKIRLVDFIPAISVIAGSSFNFDNRVQYDDLFYKLKLPLHPDLLNDNIMRRNNFYYPEQTISPFVGIATQHHFKGRWVVVNNFFYEIALKNPTWPSSLPAQTDYNKMNYLFTITYNLANPRWSIFGEFQTFNNKVYSDEYFKIGFANLISKNSQIDFNFGGSFKTTPSYTYINIGFSQRFDWHRDISESEKQAKKDFNEELKNRRKQQKVEKKSNKKSNKKTKLNPKKLAKKESKKSKKSLNKSLRENKKQLKRDQKALKKLDRKK